MVTNVRPPARPRWTLWRVLRVIVGAVLALFTGGFGFLLVVGFVASPEVLTRTLDSGFPLWPLMVLLLLLSFAAAFGGVMMVVLARPRSAGLSAPPDATTLTEGPAPIRQRRSATPPTWTLRAVVRVIIGTVLLTAGAFIVLATVGLIFTSGWDYLSSEAPGLGDSNFTAIVTLGTLGAMVIIAGYGLIAERHEPRTPKRPKPEPAPVARTGHHAE